MMNRLIFSVLLMFVSYATPAAAQTMSEMSINASQRVAWPQMAGQWVMELVSLSDTPVPIVDKVTAKTFTLVLVDVEQKENHLMLKETVCRLDTQLEMSVVQMTPSKHFTRALSGKKRKAHLVHGAEGGFELIINPRTIVHSARLEEPATEPLPTTPDDPRVYDADGDGHPGMTMRFSGLIIGEAYLVQRTQSHMRGQFISPEHIKGPMTWRTEQSIVDVSNPFLQFAPKPKAGEGRSDSFFVMRKSATKKTCANASYSEQVRLMVKDKKSLAN